MALDHRHCFPQNSRLRFVEDGHRYIYTAPDGQIIKPLSTSGVLSHAEPDAMNYASWRRSLMRDGMNAVEADLYMECFCNYRMQVGTDFHQLVMATLCPEVKAIAPPTGGEAIHMLGVWRREFQPSIKKVLIVELPMIHEDLFYTGTPDLVCEMDDGNIWLVDWKTKQSRDKARVRDDWIARLSSYAMLLKHCYGLSIDNAMNAMIWSTGLINRKWNRADLIQGSTTFIEALLKVQTVRATDCPYAAKAYATLSAWKTQ